MTLSQKTKRILLIFIPAALVAAVIVLGVLLWQPWAPSRDRQKIDQLSTYEGLLDSPITEITLYSPASHPYYRVTFSDEDLLQTWTAYLGGLEVQAEKSYSAADQEQILGTPEPSATITTETEKYSLYFCLGEHYIDRSNGEETLEYREWEDGNYRLQYDGWYYSLSAPRDLPLEETYRLAAQRYGEIGPG